MAMLTTATAGTKDEAEETGSCSKVAPNTAHPLHPSHLNMSSIESNLLLSLQDGNHPLFLQETGRWVEHGTTHTATTHFKAIIDIHHLLPITTHSLFPSLLASTSSHLGYVSGRWLKPLSQGIWALCWIYPGWTVGCSLVPSQHFPMLEHTKIYSSEYLEF